MSPKSKLAIVFSLILIAFVIILRPYYIFVSKTLQISHFKTLFSRSGLKTYNNHVNILFLGISGNDHEGPNLSDSIIVFNYNFKTNRMTTVSIPRDIWSEALRDKINSAYAYGEAKKKGSGFILAKAEVEAIIGQPIHYAAAVDFSQFEKLIDFFGGIEVNVEKSFDDYAFPIPNRNLKEPPSCGHSEEDIQKFTESYPSEEEIWKFFPCRYKHIRFDEGTTLMDGETALNFARSRHALGSEGTDFAREMRQQKIVEGIKNRLIAFAKKPNLDQYQQLYDLTNKLVKRDINNQQVSVIFKNIVFKRNFIQDKILLSENFFINPETNLSRFDGLWVLVPIGDDIDMVHRYIDCRLDQKTTCEQLKPKGEENR